MEIPGWVSSSVGIYAVLGSITFVVLIVVFGYLLLILSDLAKQVKKLTTKVDVLTDRVHTIADNVATVTTEVGVRTSGIVRLVDEKANSAVQILETLAPVFLVIGVFWRLKNVLKRK